MSPTFFIYRRLDSDTVEIHRMIRCEGVTMTFDTPDGEVTIKEGESHPRPLMRLSGPAWVQFTSALVEGKWVKQPDNSRLVKKMEEEIGWLRAQVEAVLTARYDDPPQTLPRAVAEREVASARRAGTLAQTPPMSRTINGGPIQETIAYRSDRDILESLPTRDVEF